MSASCYSNNHLSTKDSRKIHRSRTLFI